MVLILLCIFLIPLLSSFLIFDLNPLNNEENNQIIIREITTPRVAWYNNSEAPIFIDSIGAQNWIWARTQPWCIKGDGSWSDPYVVENVTIDAGGPNDCIEIRNSQNVYFKIKNCTLFNGTIGSQAGIYLYNTSKGFLIENSCSFNYYGINLEGSYNNTIQGNIAYNNTLYGIRLDRISATSFYSYNNTLMNNICYFNTIGITVLGGIETIISGNKCYNNSNMGIWLQSNSFRSKILGNECYNNKNSGIYISTNSINTTVQRNNCSFNVEGIALSFTNLVALNGNNCSLNYIGIKIEASKNNTIKGNIASNNINTGILLIEDSGVYSHNNILLGNDCSYNGEMGISLIESDNTYISGNDCYHNKNGIYLLQDSLDNKILRNNCSFNEEGIYVTLDSHNTQVIGNNCSYNTKNGMTATNGNYFTIINNIMSHNGETLPSYSGLYLQSSNNVTISGNIFNNNIYAGMQIGGNNNNLTKNTCNYNFNGILVSGNNNNLSVNTCNNNTEIGITINGAGNYVTFNILIDNIECTVDTGNDTTIHNNTCANRDSSPGEPPTPPNGNGTPSISGFDIYILIGAISIIFTILLKKRYRRIL